MKYWLRLHWLSLVATVRYFITVPFTACLNIIVIGLALSLPLGLFVLLTNGKALISTMPVDPQLSVFMHLDTSQQELNALKKKLENHSNIEKVQFISKEEGLKSLTEHSGLTDLLSGLTENPLPDAFIIHVKDYSPAKLEGLQKSLIEENGVESVLMDIAWAKRLMALFRVGEALLKVMAIVLGAGLVLITGNSIRMQILTRLEEIEVSKLIGATDAFIRWPFIYFAVFQGIAGSLLGCALVKLALHYINPHIHALAALYNVQWGLMGPQPSTVVGLCMVTALLCLIGAVFSVQRHLYRLR